jgi:hypothetical protein
MKNAKSQFKLESNCLTFNQKNNIFPLSRLFLLLEEYYGKGFFLFKVVNLEPNYLYLIIRLPFDYRDFLIFNFLDIQFIKIKIKIMTTSYLKSDPLTALSLLGFKKKWVQLT